MASTINFSSIPMEVVEAWVDAESVEARLDIIQKKLTPNSAEYVYFRTLIAEHADEKAPHDAELRAMEKKLNSERNYSCARIIERHFERMALATLAGGDADTAAASLSSFISPKTSHSRRPPSHEAAAEAAKGPSQLPPSITSKLTAERLLEEVRGSRSDSERESTNQSWVQRIRSDSGIFEDPATLKFLKSSAKNMLAVREAVLTHGLPLSGNRVALVEGILVALPEDRVVRVDEDRIAGGGGVKSLLRAIGGRKPLRITSRAAEYYAQLTLDELMQLRARGRVGNISNDAEWVGAVLARLRPAEGTYLDDSNPDGVDAYLAAIAGFVATLPAFCNNLRVWVNYHRARLSVERTGRVTGTGEGKAAVAELFKLPLMWSSSRERSDSDYARLSDRFELVHLSSGSFCGQFPLALGEVDASDVVSVLRRAVREVAALDDASERLGAEAAVSKEFFAEERAKAKLLRGQTDAKWTTALSTYEVARLRDSKQLEFVQTQAYYGVEDAVDIRVLVKGVDRLSVKLFELNTTSIYRETGAEVETDIELEGLVPATTEERVLSRSVFEEAVETFTIPELSEARRGVWVVEIVGAGLRARCLIRKGALRVVSYVSAAGHCFRVLDESNQPVPAAEASIWLAGSTYRAEAIEHPDAFPTEEDKASDDASLIIIPFTGASPSTKQIVVTASAGASDAGDDAGDAAASAAASSSTGASAAWSFSSLHSFTHEREGYSLTCGWVLDQQQLVRDNRKARLVLRPRLFLHGSSGPICPAPLSGLEEVTLTVTSTDVEGTDATKVWRDLTLSEAEEHVVEFAVPNRVKHLRFALSCKQEIAHTGAKTTLGATYSCSCNDIESSSSTADVLLRCVGGRHSLYVLGKTGEPVPHTRVEVSLTNCVNSETHRASVFTDEGGRIGLGELPYVTSVTARPSEPGIAGRSFDILPTRQHFAPAKVWANADDEEQFVIPHGLAEGETGVGRARLFSLRSATAPTPASNLYGAPCPSSVVRSDVTASLRYDAERRCIVASGLAAGRYVLLRRGTDPRDAAVKAVAVTIAPRGATESAASAAAAAAAGAASASAAGATSPRASADAAATSLRLLADAGCFVYRPLCQPAQITSVTATPATLTIRTAGAIHPSSTTAGARVHVFIDHFYPFANEGDTFADRFGSIGRSATERQVVTSSIRARSQYLDAAKLGEEHAYVLARQGQEVFPGNSLPRPSLLNTPWSQRTTKSEEQTAKAGEALGRREAERADMGYSSSPSFEGGGGMRRRGGREGGAYRSSGSFNLNPCFDFLASPAHSILNLRPDDEGVVTVSLEDVFGADPDVADAFHAAGACATIIFCDGFTTAAERVCVPSSATGEPESAEIDTSGAGPLRRCYRDLTLQEALDTASHFVQKKQIVSLQPGEGTSLTAASDTQAEEYGTVDKALRLVATLSGDSRVLAEFSWLGRWHRLSDAERRRKYSKFACHEVHLFLYFKDREWFDAVARPFIACKRAKTFIDHFVLGHDMAPFAAPGRYSMLNALEKALLAGRAHDAAGSSSHIGARALLHQLSAAAQERLFNAAISSNALEDEQDDRLASGIKTAKAAMKGRSAKLQDSMMSMEEECDDVDGLLSEMEMMSLAESRTRPSAPMAMSMASMDMAPMQQRSMTMEAACPPPMGGMSRSMAPARKSKKKASTVDRSALREVAAAERQRRQMFRAVDKTEELAETHYWNVRAGRQTEAGLISDGAFWADLAAHMGSGSGEAFVSSHFAEAVGSINEVLCAVAVLGLPFEMPEPSNVATAAGKLSWTATESPLVLFKVDVSEADAPASTRVLVGQNFFDPEDRTRTDPDGTRVEKYIESGEFVRNKVYGVQVVVTNVSASHRQLRVLMQIPQGSLPANAGFVTRTKPVTLSAYETQTLEFNFYFPFVGTFPMFPAHISAGEALEAFAHPVIVNVVLTPTVVDKTSWRYIANEAPLDRCLDYLRTENLFVNGVNLDDVAWRCSDAAGYTAITEVLRGRCEWNRSIFGYAFRHGDIPAMIEYAMHPKGEAHSTLNRLQPRFDAGLLSVSAEQGVGRTGDTVAPVASSDFFTASLSDSDMSVSGAYEHLEYSPLINARAHQLGTKRTIPNLALGAQYRRLLGSIAHAPPALVPAADRLALVYLLLLQDRVDAALAHFAKVQAPPDSAAAGGAGPSAASAAAASSASAAAATPAAGSASWCTLAYDYMAAYLDFYKPEDGLGVARSVAAAYSAYPVPRWSAKFVAIAEQLADIDAAEARATAGGTDTGSSSSQSSAKGGTAKGTREEDFGSELIREQQQARAAGGEPTLELDVNKGSAGAAPSLRVVAGNVSSVEVRYYCMDVELLFSSKPFVSAGGGAASAGGGFSFVKPNRSVTVDVSGGSGGAGLREVLVPVDTSVGSNLLIEAVAGGKRRSVTYFASTLDVEVMESAGRVRVTSAADGRPIPRAYVKVFGSTTSSGDAGDAFFFKDCYTSATGVADYASVSTDALDRVKRFAVLVVSKNHGAVVRTANKPSM